MLSPTFWESRVNLISHYFYLVLIDKSTSGKSVALVDCYSKFSEFDWFAAAGNSSRYRDHNILYNRWISLFFGYVLKALVLNNSTGEILNWIPQTKLVDNRKQGRKIVMTVDNNLVESKFLNMLFVWILTFVPNHVWKGIVGSFKCPF